MIQYFKCEKLVIMPHSSFHRLASEVGDPTDRKITFVNMTARCGSTLLSQMMSRVPKVRAMSEPWIFLHLHGHYRTNKITMDEYKRLIQSSVRLQCKKEHKKEVDQIFIKMTSMMSPQFPILKELYPNAKFIFNTRHWKPSLSSFMQIVKSIPILSFLSTNTFRVSNDSI